MGFVFSGMTGGLLVSLFLAGIVYAKAGYFPVFILVFAALAFDLFLRIIIIEQRRWPDIFHMVDKGYGVRLGRTRALLACVIAA